MRFALIALALSFAACGDDSFTVRYAPEFTRGGTSLSVFGVFKDGRLSAETWDALAPRLAGPLHSASCDIEYGPRLLAASPDVAAAVDDYARDYGVTDELLERFAPLAKSDAILLVTVAGHPPRAVDGGAPPQQAAPAMRGGRRGRGGTPSAPRGETTDRNALELSATLYSVPLKRSVAFIGMTYRGPSADEALSRFADRLAKELPGSSCVAWSEDAPPDAKSIRAMGEP